MIIYHEVWQSGSWPEMTKQTYAIRLVRTCRRVYLMAARLA